MQAYPLAACHDHARVPNDRPHPAPIALLQSARKASCHPFVCTQDPAAMILHSIPIIITENTAYFVHIREIRAINPSNTKPLNSHPYP